MEIIEDWTTIRCPWCHKIINFVEYHESGKPEIIILGLKPDKILQWEMDVSFESLKPLFSNFLAVSSKLLNQELHACCYHPGGRGSQGCVVPYISTFSRLFGLFYS